VWLEQIRLKDFRCFYGEQTIELSTDPDKNVTLIHAENGVGKTTLLNALLWCFYGITTARFERREDLVNYDAQTEGRDKAFVEVLFEHNGNRYRTRRYTRRGFKSDGEREFIATRLEKGHNIDIDNPDTFINTVTLGFKSRTRNRRSHHSTIDI